MIMMRRCIIVLLTVIVAGYMCADSNDGYYPSTLEGLCGEDLLKAVRVVIRNHDSVMRQYDEDVLWNIFSVTDKRDDGTVWDIFSNSLVGFVADDCVPSGMVCCHIVPPQWTGDAYPYSNDLSLDVHNIFPVDAEVATVKSDLIPWEVDNALYDNGVWKMGYGVMLETEIQAYEPSDEYKGDVARVLMYAAACYGGEFQWQGQSWSLFNDNSYPVFNTTSLAMMLSWCRADPVDDKERNRNEAIYAVQGNRNPFVDFPDLCEYIWGELSGVTFRFDDSDDNDGEYLKPSYNIGEKIWLRSRYVPDDAVWSVNGRDCAGNYIKASDLGVGLHELKFSTTLVTGKVTIEIKQ